jgi:ABC-2 type transport system ATP-binding protein
MPDEALVSAENLFRLYGQHCAVEDLSLRVHRGEVLGLLGPNGAGKSSTLQMLSGNLAPTRGRITINGVDLLDAPKRAKTHVGYLPERPPLYLDMSVDEYLRYCGLLHRLPPRELAGAVDAVKARCGLRDAGSRVIGNLSRGFQQRVGIAQALVHSPLVVILDEPTAGLDPIQIREIRALIRALGKTHGVILSTHILPEVQAVCDRVQIIHAGRTVFNDSLSGLGERHGSMGLIVAFRAPPSLAQLRGLPGVTAVESLARGRMRISHDGTMTAEAVANAAVENDWGLREMTPERTTLEQIFTDLIHRESEGESHRQHPALERMPV